jgi:pimeloyl-ACP methyl ester carboxylesterase
MDVPSTPALSHTQRFMRFSKRLLIATLTVALFFVLTQDIQIFPGILSGYFFRQGTLPSGTTEFNLTTTDGERILVWKRDSNLPRRKEVILFLHGNAESLSSSKHLQRWLASQGYTNYALEYRGYSGTTGFPSESGIYRDGEAAIEFILNKESVSGNDIIVMGNSIGTGPASYIAHKYKVRGLVLLAPYSSLKTLVEEMPVLGYLSPFLKYKFPTEEFIAGLKETCVVVAHGKKDDIIPYAHSVRLQSVYQGTGKFSLLLSEKAGHNNILQSVKGDLMKVVRRCVET